MEIENFKELEAFLDEEIVFEGSRICMVLNKYDLMRLCEGWRKKSIITKNNQNETTSRINERRL